MGAPADYRVAVGNLVDWYDRRARANRVYHMLLQTGLILTASALPVLASLDVRAATIVTSCIVAALTAFARLTRFDELWLRYRAVTEALRRECRLFDAALLDYVQAEDRVGLLARRVEAIVGNELSQWQNLRRHAARVGDPLGTIPGDTSGEQ